MWHADREYEQAIRELAAAIESLIEGMEKSRDRGCTDHLDCWDGAEVFWYGAIDRGKRVAKEARKLLPEG